MAPPGPSPPASELARRYQENKKTQLALEFQEAVDALGQKLNKPRLLEIASKAIGQTCIAADAVAAGSYHEVHLLTFENGLKAIARIVHSRYGAGEEQIAARFRSEKATTDFIRQSTMVPVPRIFYQSTGEDGDGVGAPFSIQEMVPGENLVRVFEHEKAAEICSEKRKALIRELVKIEIELICVKLNGVGCLYQDFEGNFVVGEHISRPNELRAISFGPWSSGKEFLEAVIHRELDILKNDPSTWIEVHRVYVCGGQTAVKIEDMIDFFNLLLKLVTHAQFPDCSSGILHADWDAFNIMVDEEDCTKVTGIVDWDYARIRPICMGDYDWTYSIFAHMASDDLSFQDLLEVRYSTFKEHAPELLATQNEYRHLSVLEYIVTYHHYGTQERLADLAQFLYQKWPQETLGFADIETFMRCI